MSNNRESERDRIKILIMCCLMSAAGVGMANCRSVFTSAICDGLSVSRGMMGWNATIDAFFSTVTLFFVPRIIQKIGVKRTTVLGAVCYMIGYTFFSTAKNVYFTYIAHVFFGTGINLFGNSILVMIATLWFGDRSGLASGIVMSAAGLGGAVYSKVISLLIDGPGWRTGGAACAVSVFLMCLPVFLYRRSLIPVTQETEKGETVEDNDERNMGKGSVIIACLVFTLAILNVSAACCFADYAVNIGYTSSQAGSILSMVMVGNIVFKVIAGYISDKIDVYFAGVVIVISNITGLIGMLFSRSFAVTCVSALLFGSMYAVTGLAVMTYARDMFGNRGYDKVFPKMNMCSSMTNAFAIPLFGAIFDRTGSYFMQFAAVGVLNVVLMMLFIISRRNKKRYDAAEAAGRE